jgi:hypothetical protein
MEKVNDAATTAQPNKQSGAASEVHNSGRGNHAEDKKPITENQTLCQTRKLSKTRHHPQGRRKPGQIPLVRSYGLLRDKSKMVHPTSIAEEVFAVRLRWTDQHECMDFEEL